MKSLAWDAYESGGVLQAKVYHAGVGTFTAANNCKQYGKTNHEYHGGGGPC